MSQPSLRSRLSRHFRTGRDRFLRELILAERARVEGRFHIADLGGRVDYWGRVGIDFLIANDIHVTVINQTADELYAGDGHERFSLAVGDCCALDDVADNQFDMVHSNSVIEHVGGYARKQAFAREVNRIAPAHYVQTPNFWFPIDPHWPVMPFFHWLPLLWRWRLLMRFKLGWGGPHRSIAHAMGDLEGTVLVDGAQMRDLFPVSRIRAERFALLAKSLIAARSRA
ncbi:class I SAM-dependent methyltransferase [Sandarakinorhabdus sp.]|uniref:class I SAM-dependent methyltransferase n=1 Tax=Sandarakinorhabdus sp. TaxID=1916663 RepID=UPI00286E90B7|nr:class I SAM-dependent methyltransferase [Sandarakinorhabdus sp.]